MSRLNESLTTDANVKRILKMQTNLRYANMVQTHLTAAQQQLDTAIFQASFLNADDAENIKDMDKMKNRMDEIRREFSDMINYMVRVHHLHYDSITKYLKMAANADLLIDENEINTKDNEVSK